LKALIFLISIAVSFSSLSYQFHISRMISPLFQDEVLCQSLTLGFYLLFMGIGTFHGSKKKMSRWFHFFNIEMLLTGFSTILAALIYMTAFSEQVFFSQFINNRQSLLGPMIPFQLASITLGYLTGLEIPLLKQLCEQKEIKVSLNFILSGSYFGAIISSFITYFFLFPNFTFSESLLCVGTVNWLCAFLTAAIILKPLSQFALRSATLLVLLFFSLQMQSFTRKAEQLFLKAYYSEIKQPNWNLQSTHNTFAFLNDLQPVQRIQSSYQTIDLIPEHIGYPEILKNEFALYLDLQPQFSESSVDLYHQTMSHGGINLSQQIPKNVLVLGGGDGLLVRELLKYDGIQRISLIELDPKIIQLAQQDFRFLRLNEDSLKNPKVQVFVTDAYQFIKTTNQKFDAVFIDFPFPFSYEISRLYSVEFYKHVSKILSEDGFAVLDCPIYRDYADVTNTPQAIIARTAQASGFQQVFLFGPLDPFLFLSQKSEKPRFNYDRLPEFVQNKTYVNLTQLSHLLPENLNEVTQINSIFKPRKFK
jgi:spermidine synthase